ncbi:MAG: aminodeoxychorismate/anthranilate synthase component II [Clostridia bacterium]|nr:aminodeoxychorismate/anthranilate synthase component II [Clostridia bacterium]
MILLIDNYDSFSYNLYQLIGSICPDISVVRNDALTISEIKALHPEAIVLSPGPGRPEDAGVCVELVRSLEGRIPVLGVCLGHQAICTAYGGVVSYAKQLMHGKESPVEFDANSILFRNLKEKISVARYHSLAAVEDSLPPCLKVIAKADDGEIMAIEHKTHPVFGVQFHPESIMTPSGKVMLQNFIQFVKGEVL